MTVAPTESTTRGDLVDGEERPCAGRTLENFAPEVIGFIAGEAELTRALEAVA